MDEERMETSIQEKNGILEKIRKSPKKYISYGVIIAIIVGVILYLNSASFLRSQIQLGTWHQIIGNEYVEEYVSEGKTTFYPNGKAFTVYNDGSGRDYDWEILDDKTLIFNGTYYDYGEWHYTGIGLVIGDRYRFTRFS